MIVRVERLLLCRVGGGEDVPSVFEPCFIKVMVGDQEVLVVIRDSPEELESLRTIMYKDYDIFLLFFSYEDVKTLENVRSKWFPEIAQHVKKPPVLVLVGLRGNLRENYQELEALGESPFGKSPVTDEMVEEVMREIGADCRMECCPNINYNVQEVMTKAVAMGLQKRKESSWAHSIIDGARKVSECNVA